MNQSFFIGATGAHQQQKAMDVSSNNISNVNTHGFKASKSRFTGLLYQNMKSADADDVRGGVGTGLWTTDTDFSAGAAAHTGRTQDYMINGNGFFAVAGFNTGEISLTRNGAFSVASRLENTDEVDEYGLPVQKLVYYLSDGSGRFVLSETGGMIEVSDPNEVQPVGVFDYINYNGMEHVDGTRFIAVDKNGGIRRGTGEVVQGMLEASNVDLANELVKVIEHQRAYSMALKMVTTSDEIENSINNLR